MAEIRQSRFDSLWSKFNFFLGLFTFGNQLKAMPYNPMIRAKFPPPWPVAILAMLGVCYALMIIPRRPVWRYNFACTAGLVLTVFAKALYPDSDWMNYGLYAAVAVLYLLAKERLGERENQTERSADGDEIN